MRYINNFIKFKTLLRELIISDIKIKYKRSILGIIWSVLNPLLTMTVISIVFSHFFKFQIENFPVYLLTGLIIFNFLSEATNIAMTSILNNAQLLKKVYIPKYIFPLAKALSSSVNLFFSLTALLIIVLFTGVEINLVTFLFPIPLIYTLLFVIGLSLILSSCVVFFRDIEHLYGVVLTAWMYMTPIIYPVEIIPEKYMFLIKVNPLYYFVDYMRQIILYNTTPSFELNLICLGFSFSALIVGLYTFYKLQDRFILYI